MEKLKIPETLAEWNDRGRGYLHSHLDMEIVAVEHRGRRDLRDQARTQGPLHAAT
jgi:hypothetical protein